MEKRIYRYDAAAKRYGSQIPDGAVVEVVKFFGRRRAIIEYRGRRFLTSSLCCWRMK